jgi:hypothetical protein
VAAKNACLHTVINRDFIVRIIVAIDDEVPGL